MPQSKIQASRLQKNLMKKESFVEENTKLWITKSIVLYCLQKLTKALGDQLQIVILANMQ